MLVSVTPATAQESAQPEPPAVSAEPEETGAADQGLSEGIEEMLIKGSSHEDLLQDVGVSVTSFDAADLRSLRIQNIADLAEYTPNLEINTAFAASNPTIFIRGIGLKDYNANAAGAVAVYQDGININSPAIQLGQLFDIESIQVLRGPQGSLNGRNATAGAILINSVVPGDEFDVSASFTYGNYNTLQAEAAITIPLIDDMLSVRFAGTANFRDGVTENQCADWDPREHNLSVDDITGTTVLSDAGIEPLVTEESTRDTYQALDPYPFLVNVTEVGEAKERFIYLNRPFANQLRRERIVAGNTNIRFNGFPTSARYAELGLPEPNAQEKALLNGVTRVATVGGENFGLSGAVTDGVCIVRAPGFIATQEGLLDRDREGAVVGLATDPDPVGSYLSALNVPTLADFQGLKRDVNDVDNWAARGVLRFTPFDGMDWVVNFHGGQNRSDSFRQQMLGANATVDGDRFIETLEEGLFSEAGAARILRDVGATGFEGTTDVRGLHKSSEEGEPIEVGEGGDDPHKGFYNRDGVENMDRWGVSVRGFWELGPVVITALGGYEWYERLVEDEGDHTPLFIQPADYEDSAYQWSSELRIEGEGDGWRTDSLMGSYRWGIGAFYLQEELDAFNLFPGVQQVIVEQTFDQELKSWAAYVNGRYWVAEPLSLEVGVRYNHEHKRFGLEAVIEPVSPDGESFDEIPEDEETDTWREWTGDFTVHYAPEWSGLELIRNDSLNFYAKIAHGFKGGHFNANITIDADPLNKEPTSLSPVAPEYINSIEIGFKSRWFEDRLILNIAAFEYWYKDLQVFDIANEEDQLPVRQLLNSDARVVGAELELQARPLPGMLIQAGGGWLKTKFVDLEVTKTVQLGQMNTSVLTTRTFNYSGNPLIAAPTWNFSTIAEYEIPLWGWGTLVPQYDFSYRSKVYLDPQKLDPISMDAYWLHNARLAYRDPSGRFEIAGWVENFLDTDYKIDVFDVSREFDSILEVYGDPRVYGFTVSFAW